MRKKEKDDDSSKNTTAILNYKVNAQKLKWQNMVTCKSLITFSLWRKSYLKPTFEKLHLNAFWHVKAIGRAYQNTHFVHNARNKSHTGASV